MHSFVQKLSTVFPLGAEEKRALQEAAGAPRLLPPDVDILKQGDKPDSVNVVLDGCAIRYKLLPDGRRQIVGFVLPGDMCDLRNYVLPDIDHNLAALCPTRIASIPHQRIAQLGETYPVLARAFWWSTLVDEAITREWLINVGQRTALERMAHLFCEVFYRMRTVGLVNGLSCDFPVTQTELAHTLGISSVHVNRTLQTLRGDNLIAFGGGRLVISDLAALETVAMFDSTYLHLGGERGAARPTPPRSSDASEPPMRP